MGYMGYMGYVGEGGVATKLLRAFAVQGSAVSHVHLTR